MNAPFCIETTRVPAKEGTNPPPDRDQYMVSAVVAAKPAVLVTFDEAVTDSLNNDLDDKENTALNRSPYLRIGWGWNGTYAAGRAVFRIASGNRGSWWHPIWISSNRS